MKYLIFNIVVAGALIYLAAGSDITWPGMKAEETVKTTAATVPAPDIDEILAKLKPMIEETATLVAEQVSEDINERTKADLSAEIENLTQRLEQTNTGQQAAAATTETSASPSPGNTQATATPTDMAARETDDLPPLPEMTVETPTVHKPLEDLQGQDVAQAPEMAEPVTNAPSPQPQVQLAEGEEMMSPRDRQRELDALVQNMELMFLDKAGE